MDGKNRVAAIERICQFFQHTLLENSRTPVPEIWPSQRFFEDTVSVRFLVPSNDIVIRYQVLPLNKQKGKRWNESYPPVKRGDWKEWSKYDGPFELKNSSLVRAVSIREGQRDSTVAVAHFFEGVSPVKITAPLERTLPDAVTGKPYSVQFKADVASARWFIAGDLVPHKKRNEAEWEYPNNMVLDGHTGRWHGTPTRPGKYWIQMWINDKEGAPATHRDYTWTVTGENLSTKPEVVAQLADPFVELVYLSEAKFPSASHVTALLNEHGICAIPLDQRLDKGSAKPAPLTKEASPGWPMWRRDPARSLWQTGNYPTKLKPIWHRQNKPTEVNELLKKAWHSDGVIRAPATQATCAEGVVVFALPQRHQIVALETETGSAKWRTSVEGRFDMARKRRSAEVVWEHDEVILRSRSLSAVPSIAVCDNAVYLGFSVENSRDRSFPDCFVQATSSFAE